MGTTSGGPGGHGLGVDELIPLWGCLLRWSLCPDELFGFEAGEFPGFVAAGLFFVHVVGVEPVVTEVLQYGIGRTGDILIIPLGNEVCSDFMCGQPFYLLPLREGIQFAARVPLRIDGLLIRKIPIRGNTTLSRFVGGEPDGRRRKKRQDGKRRRGCHEKKATFIL